MKKVLLRIIVVIVVIVVLLLSVMELAPRLLNRTSKSNIAGSKDWMAQIEDDRLLSDISIPGAHDLGARNVQLALFSKCQDLTTEELLNEGYRYLDIRLGEQYVCSEPVLAIYHGFVKCLEGNGLFGGSLYLDSVLEDCYAFLEAHPSETIVFVVKQEHSELSVAEFEELLSNYTDEERWLLTDTIPTLYEARGKIVLFRRYEDEANLGKEAGIYLNWEQQKDNSDVSKTYGSYEEKTFTAYVQDRYKYGLEDKWNAFTATVDEMDTLISEGLVINFLSTNGTPTYGHPYKYAKSLNQKWLDYDITSERLGWVVVDFGNGEIAEKIYAKN